MFALLAGRAPYRAETPELVMVLTATEPVAPLVEVAPDVPECLAAVVDRALAKDKAERFQGARSMQEALAEAYAAAFGEALPVSYLDVMAMRAALSAPPTHLTSTTGGLSAAHARVSIPVPRRVSPSAVMWGGLGAGAIALAVLLVGLAGSRSEAPSKPGAGLLENAPLDSSTVVELSAASAAADTMEGASGAPPWPAPGDADGPRGPRRVVPAWPAPPPLPVHVPSAPSAGANCDPPWTIDPVTRGRKVKPGC
jgi:hypothetical protein